MTLYSTVGVDELSIRLKTLLDRLETNLKNIAPILLAVSRDRQEVANVLEELELRGKRPTEDG